MNPVKVLVFAGSLRKDSYNKKLARFAAEAIKGMGAEATFIDLKDYPMPIYDGDIESAGGLPENAKKLKDLFFSHNALLIASPEYNSSVTGVLKNALDWVSRPAGKEEASLACFDKKVAALLSASPGALGGLRGLVHLRSILGNIKVLVLPNQIAIGKAHEAFDEAGALKDQKQGESVRSLCLELVNCTKKLSI